jgi:hypothetical protein
MDILTAVCALSGVDALANLVVKLRHGEGCVRRHAMHGPETSFL